MRRGGGVSGRTVAAGVLLAVLVPLLLPFPAWAQVRLPEDSGYISPVWLTLFGQIMRWVRGTGAIEIFMSLGVALLFFLSMMSFYSGWLAGDFREPFVRMLLASTGVALAHNGMVVSILAAAYEGFAGVGQSILREVSLDSIRDALRRVAGSVAAGLGVLAIIPALGALKLILGIGFISMVLFVTVLFVAFVALYIMVQLFAVIIIGLAILIAPVSFATLAWGPTSRWAWKWVNGVLNALFTVLFANLVVAAMAWFMSQGIDRVFAGAWGVPPAGGTVGGFITGALMPISMLVLAPLFGILALLKVETVVAHFTDAFGDFTGSMVQIATGALGLKMLGGMQKMGGLAPGAAGGGGGGGGGLGGGGGGYAGGPAPGGPAPGGPAAGHPGGIRGGGQYRQSWAHLLAWGHKPGALWPWQKGDAPGMTGGGGAPGFNPPSSPSLSATERDRKVSLGMGINAVPWKVGESPTASDPASVWAYRYAEENPGARVIKAGPKQSQVLNADSKSGVTYTKRDDGTTLMTTFRVDEQGKHVADDNRAVFVPGERPGLPGEVVLTDQDGEVHGRSPWVDWTGARDPNPPRRT
jgi:hypothetical protein